MPAQKKKLLILAILGILRDHTDADHRMRQAEMMSYLEKEYNLTATRKSVRRNLGDLQEAGYPVVFRKGWYYEPLFNPSELDILQQSVLGSTLPAAQRESIISRLQSLGGTFYEPNMGMSRTHPGNPQYLYTMSVLHDAIAQGRQVTFKYGNYDVDMELHPRLDDGGKAKIYKINPYRVVSTNGRCYLVCNVDKYDTLCHFRVDRILEIRMLKASAKPLAKVSGGEEDLQSDHYLDEHPYMYAGAVKEFRIRLPRERINDVLDWFGMGIQFEDVTDESAIAVVRADPKSVEYWLSRYAEFAEIVEK